jgi:hypothetical protein
MSPFRRLAFVALTVYLALALAPSATARVANYGGKTSAGDPVVITAAGKQLRSVVLHWIADCPSGNVVPFAAVARYVGAPSAGPPSITLGKSALYTTPLSKTGRFTGDVYALLNPQPDYLFGVTVILSGRLTATGGKGQYTALVTVLPAAGGDAIETCSARSNWTLRRGPRTYAGSTSQGEPLVLTVNARRTRITDLLVAYRMNCKDGTFFEPSDHFTFPLARSGGFGEPINDKTTLPDGSLSDRIYDLSGTVLRTTASGRLYIDDKVYAAPPDTDLTRPLRNCASPEPFTTWKAASG